MRYIHLRTVAIILPLFFSSVISFSQNCRRSDINGANINLLCNQVCSTLVFRMPHLKSTTTYLVNNIPYNPYAYTTATGIEPMEIYTDDTWSNVINMGFNFCYYGNTFNTLLMGSNSAITFDVLRAGSGSGYIINAGGAIPNTSYAPNMIFGPYHDIDPSLSSSNKKIEWRVECVAPNRRFIASYNDMRYFGSACTAQRATHQMVLYESTGIIEVYIQDKPFCTAWNGGRTILGVQDGTRTQAVDAPGKNATVWEDYNTAYRFIPSGGTSRYLSSQMFDMSGILVVSADTSTSLAGMLDLSFPNVCAPAGFNQFEIVTTFTDCVNPGNQYIIRDTITINRTNTLGATSSFTNTSCGPPTGTITVTIPPGVGTSPFSYILDGGTPVVTPALTYTFTAVGAGPHTVVVTDASTGCSSTLNITVTQTNNITANTSSTATTCSGINNGTITITPTNGSAPFSYVLDGGTPVTGGSPYTFTGLSAGNHTIVITDFSGCVSNTITVNVATGTGVIATTSLTATSCPGATNGTITVNASGGVPPYSYRLGTNPPQASNVFTGLAAGSYAITITDNVGCVRTITSTVTDGSAILANNSVTATSCFGAANGTVTLTPTNGTGPYTFVLDGTTTQTGATSTTFINLTAGSHTIVITDNPSGCLSNTININIPAGPVLTASAVSNATSCNGASNGSITVTPTSGTGPYTFSIDGGAYQAGPSPYTFNNLAVGNHTIQVTDVPTGCVTNVINVNVVAGPALITTASKTDVLCNGGATGSITVAQPTIGTPPFEYSLDNTNWQTSNIFNGLTAGTYTVYYRESNGCNNNLTITVSEPTALTATDAATAVICNGQSNGTITITTGGGVSPYDYSIDGGANWQTANTFSVAAGSHTILIRDANGCIVTRNVTVTEPAALTASSTNTSASCDGGNDGVITVTAGGGNGGNEFSIDGTTFQSSNIFNVAPGNYTVTVRDNKGCTTSFPAIVGLANNLTFTPQTDPVICESKSVQLSLTSNATVYSWTPAAGLSNTTIPNPVANPVVTTQYIVTATLGRCSVDDTVLVNVNPAPVPNAGPDGFICYGQSYTLQGSGGVVYAWTPNTTLSNTTSSNPVSTPVKDITYTLSIVSDINGCASLVTDDVYIDVTPPIKVTTFPYDTIGYPGDQFQLLVVPSDTDATTFVWSPQTGLSNPFIPNPVVTIGPVGDDKVYQVTASTIAGCKGEGYVRVRVYKGPEIYVPTGFTPNGDSRNDRLTPFPVGIKSMNYFRVYNRWGQVIFSTNRLHDGWDGRLNGVNQPSGIYVWMIEVVTNDNRTLTRKGTTTLIR
jgi:gliding motility-associated-like protein